MFEGTCCSASNVVDTENNNIPVYSIADSTIKGGLFKATSVLREGLTPAMAQTSHPDSMGLFHR